MNARLRGYISEIKKRKVDKVTLAYLAIAWLLIEVSQVVFPALFLPDWAARAVVILALVLLPFVVILAWIFDLTPQGIERTPSVELLAPARQKARLPTAGLVGRDAELQLLQDSWNAVRERTGLHVGISGEAGLGKTTLVEGFLASLDSDDSTVYIGHGRASERMAGGSAYMPFIEALTDLARSDESGDFVKLLKRIAPSWFSAVFPGTDHSSEQDVPRASSQDHMNHELTLLFQRLSADTPVILFFEDLHWADAPTVDAIVYLADRFEELHVLLIATYRESEVLRKDSPYQRARLHMQSRGSLRELKLDSLDIESVTTLLSREFPNNKFPAELPERIFNRTGGHPLFTTDLMRFLKNSGAIREEEDSWVLATSMEQVEEGLPESVRSMVERKMTIVHSDDQHLLAAAAVQGYSFHSAVIARVLDMDPEEVEDRLEKLERINALVRMVEEHQMPDRTLTSRYQFDHILYLEFSLGNLRQSRKVSMSRSTAQALETFYGESATEIASELAALYEMALEHELAADYFVSASATEKSVFAYHEAAGMARRGLDAVDAMEPSPERDELELKLQMALGGSLCITHGYASQETIDCFDRALALGNKAGERSRDADVTWGLWMAYVNMGSCEKARELSERLTQTSMHMDDPGLNGAVHYASALTHELAGQLGETLSHAEKLVASERPGIGRDRYTRFVIDPFESGKSVLLRTLATMGFTRQAEEKWAVYRMSVANDELDPRSACDVLINGCALQVFHRRPADSREFAEQTMRICEEYGFFAERAWADFWLGCAMHAEAHDQAGLEKMRVFLQMILAAGALMHHSIYIAIFAEALIDAGLREEAREWVDKGLALVDRTGQMYFTSELHRLDGELASASENQSQDAIGSMRRAVAVAGGQDAQLLEARAVLSLVDYLRKQGDAVHAQKELNDFLERARPDFESPDLVKLKALKNEH